MDCSFDKLLNEKIIKKSWIQVYKYQLHVMTYIQNISNEINDHNRVELNIPPT